MIRPSGEVLGRVCAIVNRAHNDFHHDQVGFFGFFESVPNPQVARALLDHAGNFLKSRGLTSMRGPMNFSVNDEIGMLVEGFDTPPAIMMTHNPPYYNDLMVECGLRRRQGYHRLRDRPGRTLRPRHAASPRSSNSG